MQKAAMLRCNMSQHAYLNNTRRDEAPVTVPPDEVARRSPTIRATAEAISTWFRPSRGCQEEDDANDCQTCHFRHPPSAFAAD